MEEDGSRYWAGRRVALTGATGFLGHQVAMRLRAAGARIVALLRSTSDGRRLRAAGVRCVTAPLEDEAALVNAAAGCEFLLHLAGAVDFSLDVERLIAVNVYGTANILAAAQMLGVRRVVHTSSIITVGGASRPRVLDESAPWSLAERRVPYADTKRRAEELCLHAASAGQDVVVVNPAAVVGPDDYVHSEFGNLCRRFWRGRVPCHFGGGNNFVDVRDVADGIIRAARFGRTGQRYILGGENRTYGEFFSELCLASNRQRRWLRLPGGAAPWIARFVSAQSNDPDGPALTPGLAQLAGLYFYFDSSKARRELGFQTRPLRQTLADGFAFWNEQRHARKRGELHAA